MELSGYEIQWDRKEFAPLSFWAWNDRLEEEEIERQVKGFYDQGFGGFFMHSRGGLRTPYLSDEWFHTCKTAVRAAECYGMKAWIYDEDGWPSGFAGGRVNGLGEKYQSKYLVFQSVKPPDPNHTVASYRAEAGSYRLCDFDEADLWAVYQVEENYVDLLSKKVTKAFLESTYERYREELGEYFGTVIPGFFTDEPQFFREGYPYSLELGDYFRERNGYSMKEELYRLLPRFIGAENHSFRRDFWNTVQEMMENNFSRQISGWCEKNGVIFTGHYPGEDSLIQQMVSTAGVMPKYRSAQMPGIDHLGRRITSLLLTKQVTSVAKQFRRKKVLSETFGCAGWNIPFEDMCYIWGWQAAAGINVPVLHLGAYTMAGIRKRDYPAFYSYQEPWWEEFYHISKWMEGISFKMAQGRWLEKVLVISPMESIFCVHGSDCEYTDQERGISASYRQLCDCLTDVQVGFDLCDETVLKDGASVEEGQFRVGNCGYQFLIVSKSIILTEAVWDLLERFDDQGGTVVFADQIPRSEKNRVFTKHCAVVCNVRRFWLKYFQLIHFARPAAVYEQSGFYLASGIRTAVKEDGKSLRVYLWNMQVDGDRDLMVRTEGTRNVYVVDPETLERRLLSGSTVDHEGYTLLPVRLSKKQSLLLEFDQERSGKSKEKECCQMVQQLRGTFKRTAENALTLDYASFSIDGCHYSDVMAIVKLQPAIYEAASKQSVKRLSVRYEFDNRMKTAGLKNAVVEKRECVDILCNGCSIINSLQGWYLDREFIMFSLEGSIRQGKNCIEVIYNMPEQTVRDTEGVFETEVNRFFYAVEPEAVYLLGDFSVGTDAAVSRELNHIRVSAGAGVRPEFYLTDPIAMMCSKEMTCQGLWFYRGDLKMDLNVTKCSGRKTYLKVDHLNAAFVEVQCNHVSRVCYMPPYRIDLTEYLEEGENDVSLILHGTNRNLLGPHHHVKGENLFVGCNTFKGKKGYEDTMFNFELEGEETWSDDYSFVPFGCDRIELITERYEDMEV